MDLEEDYDAPLGAPTEGSSSAAPPQSAPQTETRLPLGMEFDNRSLAERASHMAINQVSKQGIPINAMLWKNLTDDQKRQIEQVIGAGRVRFSEIFSQKRAAGGADGAFSHLKKARAERVVKVEEYPQLPDDSEVFRAAAEPRAQRPPVVRLSDRYIPESALVVAKPTVQPQGPPAASDSPLMLSQWEERIVWRPEDVALNGAGEQKSSTAAPQSGETLPGSDLVPTEAVPSSETAAQSSETVPSSEIVQSKDQQKSGLRIKLQDLKEEHERNDSLMVEPWEDAIVWDAEAIPEEALHAPLIMDHNDPFMLWEEAGDAALPADEPADPFNLSNDHYYESKKRQERVRHGVGKIVLRHSLPAVRLEYPLYKTFLTKEEARQFHRTPLHFVPRMSISLQRPRSVDEKKLRKMARNVDVAIQSQRDLTLKDESQFFLFEYSEEYPPLLMKPGMATLINNYYRKRDASDPTIPELEIGNPVILEPLDQSPLAIFADVQPGQTLTLLYNNLFRAPIFQHAPQSTDFLVVKNKGKYVLRSIPNLYVIGQTFPMTEVPTPNSRKAHTYVKNRIETFVAREFTRKDNPDRKLRVDDVFAAFPFLAEANVRKKLRTFADARAPKHGAEATHWHLRDPQKLLTEEQCRKRVTPEAVCAYESMVSAQQMLRDAGYRSQLAIEDDDDDDDALQVGDEVKLAPWRVSKNVIGSFQSKGMMQITGTGDPTGRGEGFSFIRVPSRVTVKLDNAIPRSQSVAGTESDLRKMSVETAKSILAKFGVSEEEMKIGRWKLIGLVRQFSSSSYQQGGGDGAADTRYARHARASIAEQQKGYRQEINRIWNLQFDALSSSADIPSDDDDDDMGGSDAPLGSFDPHSAASSSSQSLQPARLGRLSSPSPAPPSEADAASVRPRALKIERRVTMPDGRQVWRSEVVEDERVIDVYLAERKRRAAVEGVTIPHVEDASRPSKPLPDAVRLLQKQGRASPRAASPEPTPIKRLKLVGMSPSPSSPPKTPSGSRAASPAPVTPQEQQHEQQEEQKPTPSLKIKFKF